MSWADGVGFLGTLTYLAAYILLQVKKDFAGTITYSALNLIAPLFVMFSLIYSFNVSVFISQFIWAVLSLFAVVKAYIKRSKTAENDDDPLKRKSLPNNERLSYI